MQVNRENQKFIVIDNFLNQNEWDLVRDQIEADTYEKLNFGEDKVYRLNSGDIYKNKKKYWMSQQPWNNNYQPFAKKLSELLANSSLSPFFSDCQDASMMVHAYRPGAELGWHRDGRFVAGYTYFCHPDWHPMWGGNLLIAETDDKYDHDNFGSEPLPGTQLMDSIGNHYKQRGFTFEFAKEKKIIESKGWGHYIAPLPNRLVLISNSCYHKVERVDLAAGMNSRVSLTGFFTENPSKG